MPVGLQLIGNYFAEARLLGRAPVPAGHRLALPGVLPVLNKGAVECAIRFGLAVGAPRRPRRGVRAQELLSTPTCPRATRSASSSCRWWSAARSRSRSAKGDAYEKVVNLTRAHLEEDAGKSLHEDFHGMTGIDLNRAGTPLLEIVSEPDMRSSAEAVAYAKPCTRWCAGSTSATATCRKARSAATPTSRCAPGRPKFGTRREIKNLNSFRFLQQAIDYEISGRST
jgi:aspartyl-tRNA(Asn)/glutamyl-tRNA(Gln) amidotransferase subunit B